MDDIKIITTEQDKATYTALETAPYASFTVPKDQTVYEKIDDDTVKITRMTISTGTLISKISDIKKNLDNFNKAVDEASAKEKLSDDTLVRIEKVRKSVQADLDGATASGIIVAINDIKP